MRHKFLGMVTLIALSSLALAGCAAPEAPPPIEIKPMANAVLFGQFVAHMNPKTRSLTFERVAEPQAWGPNLEPQSLDNLPIKQDGTPGSGPANTVELVSTNCTDTPPTFQCDVELRHFYSRSFANSLVQITGITDSTGTDISSTHAGQGDGSQYGLDGSKGLWIHDAVGAPAGSGVLGAPSTGTNHGGRHWVFNNPDDVNTNVTMAVYGSLGFGSYTFSFGNGSYVDACSGGTSTTTNLQVPVTLPFDFTLWTTNSTSVKFAKNGQIGIGAVALTASGSSIALPSISAPHPIIFPFWDNLTGGQMCYQTLGSAPSRQFLIEWRGVGFKAGTPGCSLDFEAFLNEGTGNIDLVYNTMTGTGTSAGRENGAQATVGTQNVTGTAAAGEHNIQDFGTGNTWSLIPAPF